MASVSWSNVASKQLDEIIAYIETFDPSAAHRTRAKLNSLAKSLADLPNRGRPAGRFREIVTAPTYIMRYVVIGDEVTIVSVRHSRRRPLAR